MSQTSPAIVRQCLLQELEAMTSLAALLKQEQTALIDGNVDQLGTCTAQKSELVNSIGELEKQRNGCLQALGFGSDADGMKSYLLQHAGEETSLWEQLLQITAQAKEDNKNNGILINRQLTKNQASLNILQQDKHAGSFYGPSGQSLSNTITGKGYVAR